MKNKNEDLNTIYSIHEAFMSGRWEYTAIVYEVEWEDLMLIQEFVRFMSQMKARTSVKYVDDGGDGYDARGTTYYYRLIENTEAVLNDSKNSKDVKQD